MPMIPFTHLPTSVSNARRFWVTTWSFWACVSLPFWKRMLTADSGAMTLRQRAQYHFFWFWCVDYPLFWIGCCGLWLEQMLRQPDRKNRLMNGTPEFHGKQICIIGNGPSLVEGDPYGDVIDRMDEVVRFNNFQTKESGKGEWTGSKTTVHFSDSMLMPSWPEYHAPGSCVILGLFMDRLAVSGSYFLFRSAIDLQWTRARSFLFDPELGWLSKSDIHNMEQKIGTNKSKHPTSGALAIDWFVRNRPDQSVPVVIAGFDFFQGGKVHYYDETEPIYERFNDQLGVNLLHQPSKERQFVEELVAEGKVVWLRDFAKTKGAK